MRSVKSWTILCAGLSMAAFSISTVAADLKVFSTIGMQSALEELAPRFESASGDRLSFTWGTSALLTRRLEGGETADLMVLTKQDVAALARQGRLIAGSDADLASSLIAVVVKQGTPKPDISTPQAFRQTLLKAKAVAFSNPAAGGTSGVYIAGLLQRMGISEEMKSKIRYPPPGGYAAALVANGEVDLAIQQEPEVLSVAGVDLVGLLPLKLEDITVFSSGIGTASHQHKAASALIKFLHSPQARAVYQAKGLRPLAP